MNQEQYIEHEVKLRLNDKKFLSLELKIDRLVDSMGLMFDNLEDKIEKNFHLMLVIFIASVLLPIVLHAMNLI